VTFLGFADRTLDAHTHEIDTRLRSILGVLMPEEVFTPCSVDAHPDHRALAAAVDRLRPDVLADTAVLGYPIWFWNRWAWVDKATPRLRQTGQLLWRPVAHTATVRTRIVRTGEFGARKGQALQAHRSQVLASAEDPGLEVLDPSWLEMFLGSEELFFKVQEPRGH
jgi:LmbE family N-acetylglucosaminyl deacetylase